MMKPPNLIRRLRRWTQIQSALIGVICGFLVSSAVAQPLTLQIESTTGDINRSFNLANTQLVAFESGASLTLAVGSTWNFFGSAVTNASTARTAFGLVIGTNVQAFDADLSTYAGITPSANVQTLLGAVDFAAVRTSLGLVIGTNVQAYDADLATWASTTPSANGLSLISAADYAAMRGLLDLEIGTDVQAYDADLSTYAGITPSANVQTLLGAVDFAAVRTSLGLVIGTNVQAYDADLSTYAGITPSANVQTLLGAANFAAVRTSLGLVIGTDVQAYDADLAAIAALADPNADRLLFWDDSAGQFTHLTLGTGLSITGTTINATASGLSDANYGEITVGGTGTTMTINNGVVTAAKTSITGTPTGSKFLRDDWSWQTPAGGGDVVGPATATDEAIVRFDSTTGELLMDSAVTIEDGTTFRLEMTNSGFASDEVTLSMTGSGKNAFSVWNKSATGYSAYTVREHGGEERAAWGHSNADNLNYFESSNPDGATAPDMRYYFTDTGGSDTRMYLFETGRTAFYIVEDQSNPALNIAATTGIARFTYQSGFGVESRSLASDGYSSFRVLDEAGNEAGVFGHFNSENRTFIRYYGDMPFVGDTNTSTLSATGTLTLATGLTLGSAGVAITQDGDGAVTITGAGNGSDEALTLNLDDTSNTGVFTSSTGLSKLTFTSIDLEVPTETYDATSWNGDNTVPTKDAVRDQFEASIPAYASASYATYTQDSTNIPFDNTIAQNTEGTEILTASITPKRSTSKLRIHVSGSFTKATSATGLTVAVFVDSTADAIQQRYGMNVAAANGTDAISYDFDVDAGSTSSRTYKVRFGAGSGNSWVNGNQSARIGGGAAAAQLIVEEKFQ